MKRSLAEKKGSRPRRLSRRPSPEGREGAAAPRPAFLGQLYEISRVLTGFEGLETTVPALLAIAAKSLSISGLVIIEMRRGRPRLLNWHPPRQRKEAIQAARAHAL